MSTTSDPFSDTADDHMFRRQVQQSTSRSTTSSAPDTTFPGKLEGDEKAMMSWKDIATCHLISPGSPVTAAIAVVKATLGAAPFAVAYAMATGGFVAGIVLL
ncbi:Solute carrier 38 member, partial [Perkinsus olseni]